MTKTKTTYACQECDAESPQWVGRCPGCGAWDAMIEHLDAGARRASAPGSPPPVVPLSELPAADGEVRATGVSELDRVLGGGLLPGSVTVLGGEPGVGKSTLVLQALSGLAERGARCLLVTGEESPAQVRARADRLGAGAGEVLVVAETCVRQIEAVVDAVAPHVVAVDSVQTLSHPDVPGMAGSVSQVRESAQALVKMAKRASVAVVLVGHVTKDGDLAGPRALEHVVDTVLSFEGDRHHALRLLRTPKHRFGSTRELGVFEMRSSGLEAVTDPSGLFLADRRPGTPGSVVVPVLEGARPLLVEVQALVTPASTAQPRRSAQGIDGGRLAMLCAVLSSRTDVGLGRDDVYVSVAGGMRVGEPGVDLGVAVAIASARWGLAVDEGVVALGEVGLGGEIRQAAQASRRLREAARLGFRRALVPPSTPPEPAIEALVVHTLAEAVATAEAARVDYPRSHHFRPDGP